MTKTILDIRQEVKEATGPTPQDFFVDQWNAADEYLARQQANQKSMLSAAYQSGGSVPGYNSEFPDRETEQKYQEFKNSMVANVEVASRTDAFKQAYHSAYNFVEALGVRALGTVEGTGSMADKLQWKAQGRFSMDGWRPPEEVFGMSYEEFGALDFAAKSQLYQKLKAENIAKVYSNPYYQVDRPFWQGAGKITGELADPTLLLPGAAIYKGGRLVTSGRALASGAAIGAATGVLDPAAQKWAQINGVDSGDIVLGAIAGGVAGGVLSAGVRAFTKARLESKLAGTQQEASEALAKETAELSAFKETINRPDMGIDPERLAVLNREVDAKLAAVANIDPQNLANQVNYAYKLGRESEVEEYMTDLMKRSLGISDFTPEQSLFLDSFYNKLGSAKTIKESLAYQKLSDAGKEQLDDALRQVEKTAEEVRTKGFTTEAKVVEEASIPPKSGKKGKKKKAPKPDPQAKAGAEIRHEDELRKTEQEFRAVLNSVPPEQKDEFLKNIIVGRNMYKRKAGDAVDAARQAIENGDVPLSSPVGREMYSEVGRLSDMPEETAETVAEGVDNIADAAARTEVHQGNWAVRQGKRITEARSTFINTPRKYLEARLGDAGKIFIHKIDRGDRMMREFHGAGRSRIIGAFDNNGLKMSGEDGEIVRRLLAKTSKKTDNITGKHQKVAAEVRKIMDEILDEAAATKVLTPEKVAKLKARAKEVGYWPRMYNTDYLRSSSGRAEFAKRLAQARPGSRSDVEAIIRHITGGTDDEVAKMMERVSKRRDGSYRIPDDLARNLASKPTRLTDVHRSGHLEQDRKLPESLNEALEPFLINDFEHNLNAYLAETGRRLAFAREFGANDEALLDLMERANKHAPNDPALRDMREVAYLSFGDPRSKYLKQWMEHADGMAKGLSVIDSYQNLKLGRAQVLNMAQPLVNGTMKIAGTGGNPIMAYVKGLESVLVNYSKASKGWATRHRADLWHGDRIEIADRSGAAFESAFMRSHTNAVSFSDPTDKVLAGGPVGWGKNISNQFLYWTGFSSVEHLNRVVAFEMGKAHLEHLVAKKAAVLAKIEKQGPVQGLLKKRDTIDKHLAELGVDPSVHPKDLVVRDMNQGAQTFSDILQKGTPSVGEDAMRGISALDEAAMKFSNDTNFINTPMNKPLSWNSPYAKLFTKFKTFIYNQGKFAWDNTIGQMLKGNIARGSFALGTYMGIGTVTGMGVDKVRRVMSNDDKDYSWTDLMVRGFTNVGGLGITVEMLKQASEHRGGLTGFLVGPAISDTMKIFNGMHDAGIYPGQEKEMDISKLTRPAWSTFGPGTLVQKGGAAAGAWDADAGAPYIAKEEGYTPSY